MIFSRYGFASTKGVPDDQQNGIVRARSTGSGFLRCQRFRMGW
jgi:hypothetical protein